MQLNVSQLLKEPIGSTRSHHVDSIIDIGDGKRMVQGHVHLMRTNRSILVKGNLHSKVELTCSRCLSLFSCPITLNIEEEYFPTTDIFSGVSLTMIGEPGSFTIGENNTLDLTEATRQYLLLAIPMKPLCQKDCSGLCPTCGSNLNQAPCGCPSKQVDPRWAKLGKLVSANNQAYSNEGKE